MKIAIFGAGAVGGYFGGRLAAAGKDVVFIARGEHLRAIREEGLRVDSINGDFTVKPSLCTDDPMQCGLVDAIVLGVRAWQVEEAARAMCPLIGQNTIVVPLQNGVEAPFQLAAVIGAEHVLAGMCRITSALSGPGHIRHTAEEPHVAFGELDNCQSRRIERLREAFVSSGVDVEIPQDIHVEIWRKFILAAGWSGVGAITRMPIGVLRSLPETREMLEQAFREVFLVARARGVALPEDIVAEAMARVDRLPPDRTSSMQRDIEAGRPSEVDARCGAVVRLARQAGVPVSLHTFVYHSLLPLELKARAPIAPTPTQQPGLCLGRGDTSAVAPDG